MPTYSIQGNDGKTYSIEGPEGATEEQVISAIEAEMSGASSQEDKQEVQEPVVQEPAKEIGYFDEGSVIKETGEGIVSGLIAIPQGIAELGASLIDLGADTDYSSVVTDTANELRNTLGVDPEGAAGKIAEVREANRIAKIEKRQQQKEIIDTMQTIGLVFCVIAVVIIGLVTWLNSY